MFWFYITVIKKYNEATVVLLWYILFYREFDDESLNFNVL